MWRFINKFLNSDPAAMIDAALKGIVKMQDDLIKAKDVASSRIAANDEVIKQKQLENEAHMSAIDRVEKSLAGLQTLLGGT